MNMGGNPSGIKYNNPYEKNKNHSGFATWMLQQSTSQKSKLPDSSKKSKKK